MQRHIGIGVPTKKQALIPISLHAAAAEGQTGSASSASRISHTSGQQSCLASAGTKSAVHVRGRKLAAATRLDRCALTLLLSGTTAGMKAHLMTTQPGQTKKCGDSSAGEAALRQSSIIGLLRSSLTCMLSGAAECSKPQTAWCSSAVQLSKLHAIPVNMLPLLHYHELPSCRKRTLPCCVDTGKAVSLLFTSSSQPAAIMSLLHGRL